MHDGWQLEPQKASLGDDDDDETFFTPPMNIFRFRWARAQHDEADGQNGVAPSPAINILCFFRLA